MAWNVCSAVMVAGAIALAAPSAFAQQADDSEKLSPIEEALIGHSAAQSVALIAEHLERQPNDAGARFAMGIAQFLVSQESLFQELYQYGFLSRAQMLMFIAPGPAMLVPMNPDPKEIDYDTLQGIIDRWLQNVSLAEQMLAHIDVDDVKLRVRVGLVRMDLNADGEASEEEAMWRLFTALQPHREVTPEQAADFVIAFDRGDVNWLRGYCHLLMALGNAMRAYDMRELFNRTGHLFFARPKTPFAYLQELPPQDNPEAMMIGNILDVIALVHLLNFQLEDAARMQKSLEHLQHMMANAREMWQHYNAETDNDREWVPNPNQDSVIPNVKVTEEMQQAWMTFLNEADQVLKGTKLVKFWREAGGRGVNFRRVFTEPRAFDLVLWIQGTAADPYLEEGPTFDPDTIDNLEQVFGNQYFGYAAWFN